MDYRTSILHFLFCFLFVIIVVDNQPISVLRESDPLYCIELPMAKEPSEEDGAFLLLCWINMVMDDDDDDSEQGKGQQQPRRFGSVYTTQVARETSFEDLHKLLLKEMAPVIDNQVLCQKQDVCHRTFFRVI
jgi:ubiquitin carboxyl-terminal hydrolase 31